MQKTMLYGGNLGREMGWRLDIPDDWTLANLRLLVQSGMTELRVCVSGTAVLTDAVYAGKVKSVVDTIHRAGALASVSIDDTHSIVSVDQYLTPTYHDMSQQEVVDCLCAFIEMGADWVDVNEDYHLGSGANQAYIDFFGQVGAAVLARHPDANMYLSSAGYSNTAQDEEQAWSNSTVIQLILAQAAYKRLAVHCYPPDESSIAAACAVPADFPLPVVAQECHPGAYWQQSDGQVLERSAITQAGVFKFLDAFAASGVLMVMGWANVDASRGSDKIPLGMTKRTPVGAAMDAWIKQNRLLKVGTAAANIYPARLNSLITAGANVGSLNARTWKNALDGSYWQSNTDYSQGQDSLTFGVSALQLPRVGLLVTNDMYWWTLSVYPGGYDPCASDYTLWVNAVDSDPATPDSSPHWKPCPIAPFPAQFTFKGAEVKNNCVRHLFHLLDLGGAKLLRMRLTGRHASDNYTALTTRFFDFSGVHTVADFRNVHWRIVKGDSIVSNMRYDFPTVDAVVEQMTGKQTVTLGCGLPGLTAGHWSSGAGLAAYQELLTSLPGAYCLVKFYANDMNGNYFNQFAGWKGNMETLFAQAEAFGWEPCVDTPALPSAANGDGQAQSIRESILRQWLQAEGYSDTTLMRDFILTLWPQSRRLIAVTDEITYYAAHADEITDKGVHPTNTGNNAALIGQAWTAKVMNGVAALPPASPVAAAPVPTSDPAAPVSAPMVASVGVSTVSVPETPTQAPAQPIIAAPAPVSPTPAAPVVSPTQAAEAFVSALAAFRTSVTIQLDEFVRQAMSLIPATPSDPATITGLFATGQGQAGSADLHWTCGGTPAAIVGVGFPVGGGDWLGNSAASQWIAPHAAAGAGEVPGDYAYATTFTVSGDPAQVSLALRWLADDTLVSVAVNGAVTPIGVSNFKEWQAVTLTIGFLAGTNTLTCVVRNADNGISPNPSGFRLEMVAQD